MQALYSFFVLLLALTVSAVPVKRSTLDVSRLVVFGDSWSDTGNTFALTNGAWPTTVNFQGRFSNGLVWSEYFAQSTKVPLVTFAYGGASTSNSLVQGLSGKNSDVKVDGVAQQVEMYLSEMTANKAAPNGDLLALFAGGNDAFFGLPTVTGNASAESLMSSVGKLYAAGGRSFVLFQLPALQALPYFAQAANVPLQPLFAQFATDFNAALTARAGTFQSEHLDATLNVFDTSSFVKSDLKGYKNTQTACLNSTTEEVCASPKEHVYWDLFHFTSNVHEDIGKAVEKTVKKNR